MNQSFTGNSRKLRQVNLSGRNTSNPWAALSGSKSSGSQDAVAQAQADRVKRQQEREKLTASKKLQKLWRGHSSRRRQKGLWRDLWDEVEQHRLGPHPSHTSSDKSWLRGNSLPYEGSRQLADQIRLLLAFQEFRDQRPRFEDDTARLVYLGQGLRQTLTPASQSSLDTDMVSLLTRLGILTARHLRSVTLPNNETAAEAYGTSLLSIIVLLSQLVPQKVALDARIYFEALQPITHSPYGLFWRDQLQDTIAALLTSSPASASAVYTAFTMTILSQNSFAACKAVLKNLAAIVSIDSLAKAIVNQDFRMDKQRPSNLSSDQLLWQLAHFVYMHDTQKLDHDALNSYVEGLSALVGQCAQDIAQRLDLVDSPMYGSDASTPTPLPPFVREIISTIPQEPKVRAMLAVMGKASSTPVHTSNQDFDAAKRLANYALALLGAFPSKAQTIRMLLHQGTFSFISGNDVSIIQYFWTITRRTNIFQRISANHRAVVPLLRDAAPPSNQIGQAPPTQAEVARWRDEWKITILFFELYGFILKLMDDSEFFSLGRSGSFNISASATTLIGRKGALPLDDVTTMLTFLKNFAFSVYWYAADLVEANEVEEPADISVLFGKPVPVVSQPKSTVKQPENLTGNGLSQAYLKGLVTGLLRQLHEIDSRRAFANPNDWLMTDQVNLTGFISAVVSEEEKRHELVDEDDQDDEAGDDVADDLGDLNDPFNSNRTTSLLSSVFGIRQPHVPRSRDSRQTEFLERWAQKARRKRQIESLAPRLEILRNLPFFIPFETRVQIFREFIYRDQVRRRGGIVDPESWRLSVGMAAVTQGRGVDGQPLGDALSRHHAEIHRESIFEDALDQFYDLGEALKEPIQITFIDKFNTPEAGIDGGGVTKEFLMSVTKDALDPNNPAAMFCETPQKSLYPSPLLYDELAKYYASVGHAPSTDDSMTNWMRRFQFIGRIIGKCLYEGILIDVTFAGFFLLKWALTGGSTVGSNESAYRPTINDLREYDEELYQGLLKLKNYPGDVEADFGLDFTLTDTLTILGKEPKRFETITTELKPNGANIPVTNANRLEYINRVVQRKLVGQPKTVTGHFLAGLGQIIQPSWLAMFNQKELQKLVGGDSSELDIADLRNNTQYGGLYVVGDDGQEHPTVQLFWKALQDMDDDDRRKVLKFVTSTPRAPLLGFSHLNPKFSIRDSSEDQTRLPSTSTCVNLLKLPRYGDYKTMKEKLLYAVNSGAGFDLS
ncbi:hypothetical protein PV10_01698 [Exophiala mesophila]|uniref:HECT-type E3 ubiquitin transferase n=1 Tax=Exophiala mesophila TaxID=212818 RepID=A0A0D1ZVL9_EXOME|nr:uncharacterized protein PV10_01698 [Exophiala mesophila]KIV98004.1 hypothetical protein PV10_01698 [Exophiala mesophila]